MLFETTFNAETFYKKFTPILKEISVPENLVPFAECLSEYHELDLELTVEPKVFVEPQDGGDQKKAIVLLSGGIDSAWCLLWALEQGLTPQPLFVDGLNASQNSRERKAVQVLCDKLGLPLITYKHPTHLKKLHKDPSNIFKIPESFVKLQYALMAIKDDIRKEDIAGVIVTCPTNQPEYIDPTAPKKENGEPLTWFQDSEESMETFLPFLSDYIGWDFKGYYPVTMKELKIKALMDKGIFEDTCSCVCNPMFFSGHRKRSKPKYSNMCGVCWKCKENLAFISKLNLEGDEVVEDVVGQEPQMKPWQKGYELDYLKSVEGQFKAYNDLCISPFLQMKKNKVADHLHDETLILKDGFRCILKKSKARTSIKVYSNRDHHLAYKDVGEFSMDKLVIDDVNEFKEYCDQIDQNIWVISFDSIEKDLLSCGFVKLGYKYTSFGDDLAVFLLQKQIDFFGTNTNRLCFNDPLERATCVKLDLNFEVDTIAEKLAAYEFKKHYSNYNSGGWSAISLRGFSDDPSFIIKPEEMNDKWTEQNSETDFYLRDTEAYEYFNEVREIINTVAPNQKIERVRIMKLSEGAEIKKHTDLVDPDCGVGLGETARFHVPIKTKDAVFEVWGQEGKESFFLEKGSLWYLDTRKPHRVINPTSDRYHLVFDVFVDQDIREAIRRCVNVL